VVLSLRVSLLGAGDVIATLGAAATAHAGVSVEQRATPRVRLAGTDGELEAVGTLGARGAGARTLRRGAGERVAVPFEVVDRYEAQLRAFVAAVAGGRDPEAAGDPALRVFPWHDVDGRPLPAGAPKTRPVLRPR
jgi:predicted dehydrogenase